MNATAVIGEEVGETAKHYLDCKAKIEAVLKEIIDDECEHKDGDKGTVARTMLSLGKP